MVVCATPQPHEASNERPSAADATCLSRRKLQAYSWSALDLADCCYPFIARDCGEATCQGRAAKATRSACTVGQRKLRDCELQSFMGGALRRVQLRMTPTAPVLDRSAFKNTLELVALQVPSRSCQAFLSNKDLRPFILQRAFVRPIEKDPGDTALRLVLLDEQVKQLDDLSGTARAFVESSGAKFVPFQLEVSYEQCTAGEDARGRFLVRTLTAVL